MSTSRNSKDSFDLTGRGILGGLLSDKPSTSRKVENTAAKWIPVEKIVQSQLQPRQFFAKESLDSLAQTFKELGFRGAINVRPLDNDTYEIVAGERRWRAAQQAALKEVRCIIDTYSDEEALEFALMENLQREDLSKLEETEGILNFIGIKLGLPCEQIIRIIRTEGHSDKAARSDIAPSVELSQIESLLSLFNVGLQTFRTKNLRTLSLPDDLKIAHLEQNLPYSSAVELSKVKDANDRQALLSEALNNTMSFRDIKGRVRETIEETGKSTKPEEGALIKRFEAIAKRAKKSVHVLNESKKTRRIEKLLEQLEVLLLEEET